VGGEGLEDRVETARRPGAAQFRREPALMDREVMPAGEVKAADTRSGPAGSRRSAIRVSPFSRAVTGPLPRR
jgi:hypothetical protein